ncbi:MAG: hypothetical protein K9I71_09980 [Ignavibacteriales bacterium]|nr:hypothetical protein [Ignavibacteriales bacterium]MCF8316445.1 hypothetical protein [Ignavibacteriales bacterium]MCF8437925.1 hypothetical protein [Ignavibacteriales bacterium]
MDTTSLIYDALFFGTIFITGLLVFSYITYKIRVKKSGGRRPYDTPEPKKSEVAPAKKETNKPAEKPVSSASSSKDKSNAVKSGSEKQGQERDKRPQRESEKSSSPGRGSQPQNSSGSGSDVRRSKPSGDEDKNRRRNDDRRDSGNDKSNQENRDRERRREYERQKEREREKARAKEREREKSRMNDRDAQKNRSSDKSGDRFKVLSSDGKEENIRREATEKEREVFKRSKRIPGRDKRIKIINPGSEIKDEKKDKDDDRIKFD